MKRHLWLSGVLVIALAVLLMVLAACGAEATPTPTPRPPTPTSTPRPPTPTPTPLPPGATPIPPTPTPTSVPKTAEQVAYEEALKEFELVEAAAKKEGKVFVYGGMGFAPNRPYPLDMVDLFMKLYPEIKVDGQDFSTTVFLERARAETATRKRMADVATTMGTTAFYVTEEGHVLNYNPPSILEPGVPWLFHPKVQGMDDPVNFAGFSPGAVLINTNLVPNEADWPKCYKDMVDPKWKNKIVMDDPSVPVGAQHYVHGLLKAYGEEFVVNLFQNTVFFASGAAATRAVVLGEYALSWGGGGPQTFLDYPGAPIKALRMCEGSYNAQGYSWNVYKDAPHPNAAKVFVNFWYTKEAQEAASVVRAPVRMDITVKHPLADPKLLKFLPGLPATKEASLKEYPVERAWSAKILRELGKK